MKIRYEGNMISLLEGLKNLFIGKPQYPHCHMIDYGIHAVTIEGVFSQKQA
jgi:hypothetical protein